MSTANNSSVVVNQTTPSKSLDTRVGISPVHSAKLRSKELQQLLEGNIITADEYAEQKLVILDSLSVCKLV